MKPSIVIPICNIKDNNKQDLENLLISIENGDYLNNITKIVCCFDSCEEYFVNYFENKFPWFYTIWNKGNRLNFTRNVNLGLRFVHKSLETGAFVINQDCVLPNWKYLKNVIGEGLSTPESVDVKLKGDLDNLQPEEVLKTRVHNKFAFYCTYFSKELLDKIGYLDGAFKVVFSDDQYVLRTLLAGFPCEIVNTKIYHAGTHHDTNKEGSSRSGAYSGLDLGETLLQYRFQWKVPTHIQHDEIIHWVLKNYQWEDSMKVN